MKLPSLIKEQINKVSEDDLKNVIALELIDKQMSSECILLKQIDKDKINSSLTINENHFVNSKNKKHKEFFVCPSLKGRRTIVCFGKSGSGKSYWTRQYLLLYLELFPDNNIYIFSVKSNKDDDIYNGLKNTTFYNLYEDPIPDTIEGLENSICIFDDVEALPRNILKHITVLQNLILNVGRTKKISIINIQHNIFNGAQSKLLVTESDVSVFFPYSSKNETKKYLLYKQQLDKDQVNKILNLDSRAIVFLSEKNTILAEKELFILE